MTSLWLALAIISQSPASDLPSADQFLRILSGLHSEIRDITFVFEGGSGLFKDGVVKPDGTYQGLYSFRADGATLLDVFSHPLEENKPGMRTIHAILKGKMEGVSQVPDIGILQPEMTEAVPGVLNKPLSPERILYYWYFMTLGDPEAFNYQGQGWEDIDGHRCLKVQLDQIRKTRSERVGKTPLVRFWIDMDRGGHPLKVEFSDGTDLVMRTKIQLSRFTTTDGKLIWLPANGETDTFGYQGRVVKVDRSSTPMYRETYTIVDGSVRLNESLIDSYFSIKKNRKLPDVGGLRKFQREVAKTTPLRTDPVGVKERLDKNLAEAERQSEGLVATSTARQTWSSSLVIQSLLVTIGALSIGAAVLWKWRTR